MATAKKPEDKKESAVSQAQQEPPATKDVRVATGKRPRVSGTLAKPIYLIHDGKFEVTVPAVKREIIVDDLESERFSHLDLKGVEPGDVVEEVVVEGYVTSGDLPKNSRYGRRKIGVAHEITDAQEAEDLKAKGFRVATAEEIKAGVKAANRRNGGKSIDEIAAEQRVLAQKNLKRGARGFRTRDEDNE